MNKEVAAGYCYCVRINPIRIISRAEPLCMVSSLSLSLSLSPSL